MIFLHRVLQEGVVNQIRLCTTQAWKPYDFSIWAQHKLRREAVITLSAKQKQGKLANVIPIHQSAAKTALLSAKLLNCVVEAGWFLYKRNHTQIFITHRFEAAEESVSLQQMCPVEASSPRGVSEGTDQPSVGHLWWKKLANQLPDLDSTLPDWVFARLWNRKEQYSIIDHHVEITPFSALLRLQVICNYHRRGQLALTTSHNIPVLHCSQNFQAPTSCQGVTSVV